MPTKLNPYLNFRNNARDAMEFYHEVFGGDLRMQTFKEFNASTDPREDNLIMHAELDGNDCMTLMASDTPMRLEYRPGNNVSMSLSGDNMNKDQLVNICDQLSRSGTVTQPLAPAAWGDTFGRVTDQFGVNWLVNIAAAKMED